MSVSTRGTADIRVVHRGVVPILIENQRAIRDLLSTVRALQLMLLDFVCFSCPDTYYTAYERTGN